MDLLHRYSEFTYWFYPISRDVFAVYNITGESPKLEYARLSKAGIIASDNICSADFEKYMTRPEYAVFRYSSADIRSEDQWKDLYNEILVGACMVRYWSSGKNPDEYLESESCNKMLSWLELTDFYSCPGSTIYHDSYRTGLLLHTLRVISHIIELKDIQSFESVDLSSAIICGAVHDWCKIGRYETFMKNVKNEDTGKWEQVSAYRYKSEGYINLGHGVSSLYLACKFIPLSAGMAAAIRWHMGEYNVADNEASELHTCNEKYPLVFMLQFADRLSIAPYANSNLL